MVYKHIIVYMIMKQSQVDPRLSDYKTLFRLIKAFRLSKVMRLEESDSQTFSFKVSIVNAVSDQNQHLCRLF